MTGYAVLMAVLLTVAVVAAWVTDRLERRERAMQRHPSHPDRQNRAYQNRRI